MYFSCFKLDIELKEEDSQHVVLVEGDSDGEESIKAYNSLMHLVTCPLRMKVIEESNRYDQVQLKFYVWDANWGPWLIFKFPDIRKH